MATAPPADLELEAAEGLLDLAHGPWRLPGIGTDSDAYTSTTDSDEEADDYAREYASRHRLMHAHGKYDVGHDYDPVCDEPLELNKASHASRGRSRTLHQLGRRRRSHGPRRKRSRPLNVAPTIFDGTGNWEEFKEDFSGCAEMGGWTKSQKTKLLAHYLRNKARTFYWALPDDVKCSYSKSIRALEIRYGSQRKQELYKSLLSERKRKADESISELADEIRMLTLKAYPQLPDDAKEALAYASFQKAVDRDLKIKFLDKGCVNMDEAVEVAERYEILIGRSRTSGENQKSRVPVITCYKCGKNGHIARVCRSSGQSVYMPPPGRFPSGPPQGQYSSPSPPVGFPPGPPPQSMPPPRGPVGGQPPPRMQGPPPQRPPPGPQQQYGSPSPVNYGPTNKACFNCGAVGHLAKRCPARMVNSNPPAHQATGWWENRGQ